MNSNVNYNKKIEGSTLKLFFILIGFSVTLSISHMFIEELFFKNSTEKLAIENSVKKVSEREKIITNFLLEAKRELEFLKNLKVTKNYLTNNSKEKELKSIFLNYAKSKPNFMRLRFIDSSGKEKIRIERETPNSELYFVAEDKLQNKSDKYYFNLSKTNQNQEVFFSAIDPNLENGKLTQNTILTFRAILPIKHNNSFKGVFVINYFVDELLTDFTNAPLYDMFIFNNEGYILYNSKDRKFFNLRKQSEHHISKYFPNDFEKIISSNFLKTEKYFTKKLDQPILNGFNVIFQLKEKYLNKQKDEAKTQYFLVSITILIFSILLTFIIIKLFTKKILNIKELKTLNERLNRASKISKIGFWESDYKSNILSCSKGIYEILDLKEQEIDLSIKKFLSYLPEHDREIAQKEFIDSIKEKREFFLTHKVLTNKGQLKYIEGRAKHYFDSKGNFIESIGSMADITEKYLLVQKYKRILDIASDAIFVMDSKGKLVEYSNRTKELLGYTHKEMKQLNIFDWDKEITSEIYENILKELSDEPITIKRTHTRKDNTTYTADITITKAFIQDNFYVYASVRKIL